MGRRRKNAVHSFFSYDKANNESSCLVRGCSAKLKGNHATNLLYHISSKHEQEYQTVVRRNSLHDDDERENDINQSNQRSDNASTAASTSSDNASTPMSTKSKRSKKLDYLKEQCVDLVTNHGRPFSIINDKAFKNIIALTTIDPKELATVNSSTIRQQVVQMADEKRREISSQLKDRLLSIKIDGATRLDRCFIGVNAQYIDDGKIIIKCLGVVELFTRSTAENLKEKLLYILRKYYVSIRQILTITTDNGSNMLKMVKSLNENSEEDYGEDIYNEEDSDIEEIAEQEVPSIILDGNMDEDEDSTTYITSVRCAAHTLQLAVGDALRENEATSVIQHAKEVVLRLRTPNVRQLLIAGNKKKPILNCATRWHSTVDMLERLIELRDCCSTNADHYLYMSETSWIAISDVVKSLKPAKILTKILQAEQLTIGDFYYEWSKCLLETRKIQVPLAQFICQAMETRQRTLMENPNFVSALYLDPRFQVVLSEEETLTAFQYLKSIWSRILLLKSRPGQQIDTSDHVEADETVQYDVSVDSTVESEMEIMLECTARRRERQRQNIERRSNILVLLEAFGGQRRLGSKENVLEFWKKKKISDPQLYHLASAVLATPSTQVSVERLFSSLKFIMSDLRYNLTDSIVEDILVLRNNK